MIWAKSIGSIVTASTLLVFAASAANSQETAQDDANFTDLNAYQSFTEEAERLRCYDTAIGNVVAASDAGRSADH